MPKSCSFRASIPMRTRLLYLQAVLLQGLSLRAREYASRARGFRCLQDAVPDRRGVAGDRGEPGVASGADRIPHRAAGRMVERRQPFPVKRPRDAALVTAAAEALPVRVE